MNLQILFSVATAFCWGGSDFLAGLFSRKLNAITSLFYISFTSLVGASLLLLLSGVSGLFMFPEQVLIIFLISQLTTLAYLAMVRALIVGPIGIASATANTYPLITIAIATITGGVVLSRGIVLGAMAVFAGGALMSIDLDEGRLSLFKSRAFRIALIASLAWGVSFYFYDSAAPDLSWAQKTFITALGNVIYTSAGLLLKGVNPVYAIKPLFACSMWAAWASGLLSIAGLSAFFIAADHGSVVLPAVIASASPALSALLAAAFLGQKINKYAAAGILITIFGVMVLNIA